MSYSATPAGAALPALSRDRGRLDLGLPLPPLNALQAQIATHLLAIEDLAERSDANGADGDLYTAVASLARAMDAAGVERGEFGERLHPCDEEGWRPWEAVERWVLADGDGTGSARVLAVCYLATSLGVQLDWRAVCGGTLDGARTRLAEELIRTRKPAGLPRCFWRTFVIYRESLAREMDR